MPVERGGRPLPSRPVFQRFDAGSGGAAGGNSEGSAFRRFFPRMYKSVNWFPLACPQTRIDGMGITMDIVLEEARAVPEAATALTLKWAYHAFTFGIQSSSDQGRVIREYNVFQAETGKQGNVVRGVEIRAGEEKETFLWMLNQAGIPHSLGEGDMCIPFLPMEQEMQRTIRRKARRWVSRDH